MVVNLSTSLVVEDAARAHGARFFRAPVGEKAQASGNLYHRWRVRRSQPVQMVFFSKRIPIRPKRFPMDRIWFRSANSRL